MNVQKYLQQIKVLDAKIKQKQQQYIKLKAAASSAGAIRYDKEVVQTTRTGDRLEKLVLQYIELEQEINQEKFRLEQAKQTIINQIHSLNDDRFINVLFKRYVEYKSYELIAVEMNYSFDYVKELHRKALDSFAAKHPTLSHL